MMKIDNRRNFTSTVRIFLLIMIIISCVTPRELSIVGYWDDINRQYGSEWSVAIPTIFMILFLLTGRLRHKRGCIFSSPLCQFLLLGICSGIVIPINGAGFFYYFVGASKYVVYIFLYWILINNLTYEEFSIAIDWGAKISLIFQSIIGMLYVFLGILIPFISSYTTNKRNGLPRMVGSFSHPGDFSLYLAILFCYFLCKLLYEQKKTYVIYTVLSAIDIYLTGARTMLVVSAAIFILALIWKYRNYFITRVIICIGAIGGIYWFIGTDLYYELFVRNDIVDMLMARLAHWIIGIKIMTADFLNLIFGVGLNNHVTYIDENYYQFSDVVMLASSILDSEFVRGMPIHNSFFIVGCELGIVGLILYIRIFVLAIFRALKLMKSSIEAKSIGMIFITSIATIMLYSLQGWASHKNFAWVMFVIILSYQNVSIRSIKNKSI